MTPKLKTIMKKSLFIVPLLFLLGFSAEYMSGCASTPNRITYAGVATTRVATQTALQFWNDQFVATGKSTVAQETAVRNAYMKVRASAIAVCDAGVIMAANVGNTNASSVAVTTFETAVSNAAQDKADFINLLGQFGVKGL